MNKIHHISHIILQKKSKNHSCLYIFSILWCNYRKRDFNLERGGNMGVFELNIQT